MYVFALEENMESWSGIIPSYYRYIHKMDIGSNVVIARAALLNRNVNPLGYTYR